MISTYRHDFSNPDTTLPPVHHYQEPCFTYKEDLLNQRCFPFAFPSFPSRKRESEIPIAAGFETLVHRSVPVQLDNVATKPRTDTYNDAPVTEISDEIPQVVFEELINLATYTPSSKLPLFRIPHQQNSQSANKPPSLRETQRLVKNFNFRGAKKYHEKPGIWQQIGCVWDKAQERQTSGFKNNESDSTRLLARPRVEKPWVQKEEKQPNEFPSNILGYGGYQARLPHVVKPEAKQKSPMISSSRIDYRKYPAITYSLPKAGHQGPLSRTVTLTQPYNPFNKVQKHRITVK